MHVIEEFKSKLETLKTEFQNKTTFNPDELKHRQEIARKQYDQYQSFSEIGLRTIVIKLQEKFGEGWTYVDSLGGTEYVAPSFYKVRLKKPEDIIDADLSDIDAKTEAQYRTDIESAKEPLLLEIAKAQLALKDAEAAEKEKAKREASLAKELEKITKELLSPVVEDVAEQYFLILMRRCFFQDVQEDRYGNIVSVKIHDLMHDVAQEVSKEEISDVSSGEINLGEKDRHVNIISDGIANLSLCSRRIRSYISRNKMTTCSLWEYLTTLRVLDLSYSDFTSLPQMIDRLLLLRYLNLGHNRSLVILPDSITRLYNLQTLVLYGCERLRKVPEDFSRLINLGIEISMVVIS